MSPADLDVARELAARPRWEWRAGLRAVDGRTGTEPLRLTRRADDGCGYGVPDGPAVAPGPDDCWTGAGDVPDLHDPTGATAGVLLVMLQEALSADVFVHTGHGGRVGAVVSWMGQRYEGSTLAVAAARALLAAWGPA